MRYYFIILFLILTCDWIQKELEQLEDFKGKKGNELLDELDLEKDVVDKFRVEKKEKNLEVKPLKKVIKKVAKSKKKKSKEEILDYPDNFKELDTKSKKLWKDYKPVVYIGESTVYDIDYGALTIGKIAINVLPDEKIQGEDVFHFAARMKSAPFYSYIYEIDDKIETFIDKKSFLPIKFSLLQNESNKTVDDLQLFDKETSKTYFRYKKVKKGQASYKKSDVLIPHFFQDSFSAIFFMRGLPHIPGKKYQFPVVTRGKIWLMDITIEKKEEIDTEIGEKVATKVNVITRYEGDVVKKGLMTFWFSDDERKLLLKFKGDVKIGAIRGNIVSFQK